MPRMWYREDRGRNPRQSLLCREQHSLTARAYALCGEHPWAHPITYRRSYTSIRQCRLHEDCLSAQRRRRLDSLSGNGASE